MTNPVRLVSFDPHGPGAGAVALVAQVVTAVPRTSVCDLLFNLLCEATVGLAKAEGPERARERLQMASDLLARPG